jgi:hypothetical protein
MPEAGDSSASGATLRRENRGDRRLLPTSLHRNRRQLPVEIGSSRAVLCSSRETSTQRSPRSPNASRNRSKEASPLRAGLEALVLSALAARSAEAVVVINAEQSVSFYSAATAKLLRLPLPAEPMTLAEIRFQHPLFDTESVRLRSLPRSQHRAAEGELVPSVAGRSGSHLLGKGSAVLRRRPIPGGCDVHDSYC